MLPWYYKTETYGNYWRMNSGKYDYKVLFYEKDSDKYSCAGKFPLTLSDGQQITQEGFVEIVKEALQQINDLGIGLEFNCTGFGTTDKDIAYNMNDDTNALVYYWNWMYGGLAGPMSRKGFGVKLDMIDRGRREWYVGCIRHEMTHVLGFAHKGVKNPFKNIPFLTGYKIKKEMTEDTVSGLDIVYGIDSPYKIFGKVLDKSLYEFGEAYIVDWDNKLLRFQSPIDSNGYFEFRLREKLGKFKVFVCSKSCNHAYGELIRFNETHGRALKMSKKNTNIDLGEISLVNGAKNWEEAVGLIGLKL